MDLFANTGLERWAYPARGLVGPCAAPWFILAVSVALLLTGCETIVQPVTDTEKAYSIYGVLDPTRNDQFVQIYPIENRLTPYSPSDSLDVRVTSRRMQDTARTTHWRGETRQLDDEVKFVYRTTRPFDYGTRYRLTVTGSRGESSIEVAIPEEARIRVTDLDTSRGSVIQTVRIDRPVPRLLHVRVRYYVQFNPGRRLR